MRLLSLLTELAADLNRQRLRTALTVLGITWGTVAVVVLLAFGVGLQRQMVLNAKGIGDAIAIVWPGQTTKPWHGFGLGRPIRLHPADVALLRREVPGIALIGPEYGRWGVQVRRGTAATNVYLTGVTPDYSELRNVFARTGGRFIDELDVEHRRRVAFLGNDLEKLLFGDQSAVGRSVLVDGTPFMVIGVMVKKTQNSSYRSRDQNRLFIPSSTWTSIYGGRTVSNIVYEPHDTRTAAAVARHVREVLAQRYTFDPTDKSAIQIWDTADQLKFFSYLFIGFNLFLGVVGCFTLVVGGVGVANVMYVVVQERTREIGVRRSVGARRRDILVRVLFEAGLIVAVGATAGILISGALVWAVGLLPIQEYVGTPVISSTVGTVTASLLLAVALLAGLMPARRAARLDPAESLRWGS